MTDQTQVSNAAAAGDIRSPVPEAPGRILPVVMVSVADAIAVRTAMDAIGRAFELARPADQVRIARFVVTHLQLAAPVLCAAVDAALDCGAVAHFRGLPIDGDGDQLMEAVLSLLRGGDIFQYAEQLDGQLIAAIEPKLGGAPNSNASPEPFGFHTDDAIMPARFRVEEISLLSVFNPAGTLTGFALLEDIL